MIKWLRNKKSVVVMIVGVFWAAYIIITVATFISESYEFYDQNLGDRKQIMRFHFFNAENFLLNNKPQALIDRLEKATELQQFDFFILKEKGKVLAHSQNTDASLWTDEHLQTGNITETNDYILGTHQIYDYKLILGIAKSKYLFLKRQINVRWPSIIKDVGTMTVVVAIIVYIILQDLIQMSKVLRSKNRSSAGHIHAKSSEAETILRATQGFEYSNQDLSQKNRMISNSITPALLNEIKTGKPAPYLVSCTMARIDMNDYTRLMLDSDPKELQSVISQFFKLSRELIERYGGAIYEYVGDEIIFLFKNEDHSVSASLCLRAIASIFHEAGQIKCATFPDGIKLKASMVPGTVHFIQPDLIYAFSGKSLAETGRMFPHVEQKTENAVIMYSQTVELVSRLCTVAVEKQRIFKGFGTESSLSVVRQFTTVAEAAQNFDSKMLSFLFRNREDIIFILEVLDRYIFENDTDNIFAVYSGFREYRLQSGSPAINDRCLGLLSTCLNNGFHLQTESRVLSGLLSVVQNLITKPTLNEKLPSILDIIETAKDPRVVANVITLKSALGFRLKDVSAHLSSTSNRIMADTAIYQSRLDFDEQVYQALIRGFTSSKPLFIASSIYAITEIILHYMATDKVYLATNQRFEELAMLIPKGFHHENSLVANRALVSYRLLRESGVFSILRKLQSTQEPSERKAS